jgi:phospholipid/cholesterol/gamma-HCH transport system substrate-binding protein
MSGRTTVRDVAVGLLVTAGLIGLIGLMILASDGPGFLASRQAIDVIFRDAQGVRVGSPVRVAGLDTGNVVDLDLVEVEGSLRARVRISLPTQLVKKLRQDVKISITPGLTGMSHVNIVSAGSSAEPLDPRRFTLGVETSFFDPIIEQVGLGPVERNHLSHTIAEVRQTVDSVGPSLRQVLHSLQETAANIRGLSDTIRPTVQATLSHVEHLSAQIDASAPRIESAINRIDLLTRHGEAILRENRENLGATLASTRQLTASVNDLLATNRPKMERLLEGVEMTRARADRVLYQADLIATQGVHVMTRSRAEVERSVSNVRDATDWANKLVQKLYTNPFVLSPFYKPSNEDLRVQSIYDTAQVFTKGAQELHDSIKTLEAMRARPLGPDEQRELIQLEQNARAVSERLGQTSALLAEGLKHSQEPARRRR